MKNSENIIIYDLRGLNCPLPVLKTRRKLQDLAVGTLLKVRVTDPMSRIDIPHFCNEEHHEIIKIETSENITDFWIRKGEEKP